MSLGGWRMDKEFLAELEASPPAVVIDLNTVRRIRIHNRTLAAFQTLSGIPTRPIRSIQEWDELEERLGVLL